MSSLLFLQIQGQRGKHWALKSPAKHVKSFRIYRWDPAKDARRLWTLRDRSRSLRAMVLDALVKINDQIDPTLSFRRFAAKACAVPAQ